LPFVSARSSQLGHGIGASKRRKKSLAAFGGGHREWRRLGRNFWAFRLLSFARRRVGERFASLPHGATQRAANARVESGRGAVFTATQFARRSGRVAQRSDRG